MARIPLENGAQSCAPFSYSVGNPKNVTIGERVEHRLTRQDVMKLYRTLSGFRRSFMVKTEMGKVR